MNKSFTLIEILVVIVIIGILSGFIIVSMAGVSSKATIAKGQAFSNSLKNSILLNLVSEWKLDEGGSSQTTADAWGTNNGTLGSTGGVDANDPTWVSSGCISGNCLQFDGVDDYVNCGTASNLNITGFLTISAWAKTSNLPNQYYQAIVHKTGDYIDQQGYAVSLSLNKWTATISQSSGVYDSLSWPTTPAIGAWYNIVFSYDGSAMKFYINGEPTQKSTSVVLASGSQPLRIGKGLYYSGFNGLIDDVRIYNAAIPTSQVQENYYSGLNRLLVKGVILAGEYFQRIGELD